MPSPRTLSVVEAIEAKYTGDEKRFKSLGHMFTNDALIDMGLVVLTKPGQYEWKGSNEFKTREDFLNASPERLKELTAEYIEIGQAYLPNELKIAKPSGKHFSKETTEDFLMESVFVNGARGTVRKYGIDGLEKSITNVPNKNRSLNSELSTVSTPSNLPSEILNEPNKVLFIKDKLLTGTTSEAATVNRRENTALPAENNNSTSKGTYEENTKKEEEVEKTVHLKEVVKTEFRKNLPDSELTLEDANRKINAEYKAFIPQAKDTEDLVRKARELHRKLGIKKGISYYVDETDRVAINGNVGMPENFLPGKVEGLELDDRKRTGKSLFVANKTGTISNEEHLYLALVAKFSGKVPLLNDDNKDVLESGSFSVKNGIVSLTFRPKPEAVAGLVDYLADADINKLKNKDITITFNKDFTLEKYQDYLKDKQPSMSGLKAVFFDETPKTVDLNGIFGELDQNQTSVAIPVKDYRRDFAKVNKLLGLYPGVTIEDYKNYFYNKLAEEKDSYAVWYNNNKVSKNPNKTTEEKEGAQNQLSSARSNAVEEVKSMRENLQELEDFKYKGNDPKVKNALKILKLLAKDDIEKAELDIKILDAKNVDEINHLVGKYDKQRNKTEIKLTELGLYNSGESMNLLKQANGGKNFFTQSDHVLEFNSKPWTEVGAEKFISQNNLSPIPLPQKGFSEHLPADVWAGVSTFRQPIRGNDGINFKTAMSTNLGVRFDYTAYHTKTNNFFTNIKADINSAFINNMGATGENKFLTPLKFNSLDYLNRQNLQLTTTFTENSFNQSNVNASFNANTVGTSRSFSLNHSFVNVSGNSTKIGIELPGKVSQSNFEISTFVGVKLGKSGRLYLTGDNILYSADVSFSKAGYKPLNNLDNSVGGNYLSAKANLTYMGKVTGIFGGEFNSFNSTNGENQNSMLNLHSSLAKNWTANPASGKGFEVKWNNLYVHSGNFSMFDTKAEAIFKNTNVSKSLFVGSTFLNLDMDVVKAAGRTLNAGISFDINKKDDSKHNPFEGLKLTIDGSLPLTGGNSFPYRTFGVSVSKSIK